MSVLGVMRACLGLGLGLGLCVGVALAEGPAPRMGTTLVAARWGNSPRDGGVVVGADSRTSRGTLVSNRLADKVTALSESIVVARSGSAADSQLVVERARHEMARAQLECDGQAMTVRASAQLVSRLCHDNDGLSVSLLCAGWDHVHGAQLFSVPRGGSLVAATDVGFAFSGSGSAFVLGWCDAHWHPGMTQDECVEFVDQALALATARDGSSGGARQLVTIDASGTRRQVRGPADGAGS